MADQLNREHRCPRCGYWGSKPMHLVTYDDALQVKLWEGDAQDCANCGWTVWPPEAVAQMDPPTAEDIAEWPEWWSLDAVQKDQSEE